MENPAYDLSSQEVSSGPRTMTSRMPSDSQSQLPFSSQQELYDHMQASKLRKNRMKSTSAAAIAAQRNRNTSVFDDTDQLIDDDSVVVYDERTAL